MKQPNRQYTEAAKTYIENVSDQLSELKHASIITATGPINFIPAGIRVMSPDVALLRLLEFHRRATGSHGPFLLRATSKLTRRAAKRAYGNALVSLLAQISVIPQIGRERLLDLVCRFAENVGSIDGLESVWLTALLSVDRSPLTNVALGTFTSLRLPHTLGSGVKYIPFVDPKRSRVCFASVDTFAQLRKSIVKNAEGVLSLPDIDITAGQTGPFANSPLARPGTLEDGGISLNDWWQFCSATLQITTVTGATIGAFAGGIGAGPGAIGGGAFGLGVCIGSGIVIGVDALPGNYSGGSTDATSTSETEDEKNAPSAGTPGRTDTSSGSSAGSSTDGGDGNNGDNGDKGDTIECGGTGPAGYPSPDDPGGNDGGAFFPGHLPRGTGLASVFSLTSSGSLQFGAFPQLDANGNTVSRGFLSV
jgi:hypothetical protein